MFDRTQIAEPLYERASVEYRPATHVRRCMSCLERPPLAGRVYCGACDERIKLNCWDNVSKAAL